MVTCLVTYRSDNAKLGRYLTTGSLQRACLSPTIPDTTVADSDLETEARRNTVRLSTGTPVSMFRTPNPFA
jgi:hypothetical protein